jgi:hypothetical protein
MARRPEAKDTTRRIALCPPDDEWRPPELARPYGSFSVGSRSVLGLLSGGCCLEVEALACRVHRGVERHDSVNLRKAE